MVLENANWIKAGFVRMLDSLAICGSVDAQGEDILLRKYIEHRYHGRVRATRETFSITILNGEGRCKHSLIACNHVDTIGTPGILVYMLLIRCRTSLLYIVTFSCFRWTAYIQFQIGLWSFCFPTADFNGHTNRV